MNRDAASRTVTNGSSDALRKQTLFCVSNLAEVSGAPTSARLHLKLLRDRFADAALILEQHGLQEDVCRKEGVPFRVFPLLHMGLRKAPFHRKLMDGLRIVRSRFAHIRELRRLFSSVDCIVHVHSLCAPWALIAARLAGAPVVLHVREARRPGVEQWLEEKVAVWAATRIVTVSDAVRCQYGAAFREKAVTVYNFIDPELATADPSRRRRADGPPLIALLGYLHRTKGVAEFIEICRILRERGTSFRAALVGPFASADFEAECRSAASRMGLTDVLEFTGLQHNMADWYQRIDILVHPTWRDSLPRAVMEAMFFGMPVVGSDVDGVPELVRDGETGFLVAPKDVEGFAARVQSLLEKPEERIRLGAAARAQALRQFGADTYRARMVEIYREVTRGDGRRNA